MYSEVNPEQENGRRSRSTSNQQKHTVAGVHLTVLAVDAELAVFVLGEETLDATDHVELEPALPVQVVQHVHEFARVCEVLLHLLPGRAVHAVVARATRAATARRRSGASRRATRARLLRRKRDRTAAARRTQLAAALTSCEQEK